MNDDLVVHEAATEGEPTATPSAEAPRVSSAQRRPLKFEGLRIDGFKSFADRVDLPIETGITGVVGPNGCGKSNLLEALRWALGERSARNMRGDGMDDVIFAGSERRSARSVAEVVLSLDNAGRTATPEFNETDRLEVSRRIDRGQGTSYRVNGKPARQKDVQILFADNAAGATSPAIVSQGRVNKLIQDKPSDRRIVLEEAAGGSGLSSRRHEADLRLNQTEANLARADDALVQSNELVASLRRQARQVQRRREIDGLVREAAAHLMHLRVMDAERAESLARANHKEADQRVEGAILAVRASERNRDEALSRVSPARDARALAETAFARSAARLEGIENEAARLVQELQDARRRVMEIAVDRKRVDDQMAEASRTVEALTSEREDLAAESAEAPEAIEQASNATEAAQDFARLVEIEVSDLAAEAATRQATRAAAIRQRDEATRRLEAVERRLSEAELKLQAARGDLSEDAEDAAIAEAVETAEVAAREAEAALVDCEAALALAKDHEAEAEARLRSLNGEATTVAAEIKGLEAVGSNSPSMDPVSGRLIVPAGMELALASALGDGLDAGTNPSEQTWWEDVAGDRPGGLADQVGGVAELRTALTHVELCDSDADVFGRAHMLSPGQILVSQSGAFARWDGLRGRGRASAGSESLKRANRLRELRAQADVLASELDVAHVEKNAAHERLERSRALADHARRKSRQLFDELVRLREPLAARAKLAEQRKSRVVIVESEVARARQERADASEQLLAANQAVAEIPADDEASRRLEEARRKLDAARREEQATRAQFEKLRAAHAFREQRFRTIISQEADWRRRLGEATENRAQLTARAEEAERILEEAAQRPESPDEVVEIARAEVAARREELDQAIAKQDEAERLREQADHELRGSEGQLAQLREARARDLAAIEQAVATCRVIADQVKERFEVEVAALETIAPRPDWPMDMPAAKAAAEQAFARRERERDSLGAVNFLAEQELADQEKRLGEMERARAELRDTIGKLREQITEIENEARVRLQAAFQLIDRHFGELFVRLFGGGEAQLKLVGSEDILTAGLEILASPPGKRLQVLSLLSGGEQALTAMALVFAAFLSNPAPICVLDEVDAPLDDANTDRLCRLIEQMAQNDATRFLVVTHRPLTMARMNRLYGVTMAERGVSSVTRVDLDRAVEFAKE